MNTELSKIKTLLGAQQASLLTKSTKLLLWIRELQAALSAANALPKGGLIKKMNISTIERGGQRKETHHTIIITICSRHQIKLLTGEMALTLVLSVRVVGSQHATRTFVRTVLNT